MDYYRNDAPVFLMFFIRPHTLKEVFKAIKESKPKTLFLVSDGPRENIQSDLELNNECKQIVEDIDWECKVYKYYSNENKGMYITLYDSLKKAFDIVDRLIFLEDDILPSKSFFPFCAEMLEKYKDDERIHMICGMNHLGEYNEPTSDYFFSKAGSIWGFAIWKRTYESFDYHMNYADDSFALDLLKQNSPIHRKVFLKYAQRRLNNSLEMEKRIAFEFQCGLSMYLQNRLILVAKKNMIHCMGATAGATHSPNDYRLLPKGIRRIFNMKTYEYQFPLKHPQYIMEDKVYELKVERILANRHPMVKIYRKLEGKIRKMIYGDKKNLI